MILSGARGFGLSSALGRGRAGVVVLSAAALLVVGLSAPAAAQASVDRIVVTVSSRSATVGVPFTVTARALNPAGHTDTSFNGPATWSDTSGV